MMASHSNNARIASHSVAFIGPRAASIITGPAGQPSSGLENKFSILFFFIRLLEMLSMLKRPE